MLLTVGIPVVAAVGAFIAGVLFERRNPKKTEVAIADVKSVVAKLQADVAAIASKLK